MGFEGVVEELPLAKRQSGRGQTYAEIVVASPQAVDEHPIGESWRLGPRGLLCVLPILVLALAREGDALV